MSDSSKIDMRDLFALKSDLLIAADLVRNKSVKGRLVEHAGLISRLIAERVSERSTTQSAAGEPVAEFFVDFDTLRKALSIYGLAAPVSNEELGLQMDRQAVRVIEAVARLPFPYPPAAAHGDEAVRKRIRQLEVLLDRCRDHVIESIELMDDYDGAEEDAGIAQELLDDIDAAMRAQGDGGSGDA